MTIGSLFSGIGGFDLGFEQAGMRVLWQCEADKNCQKLLIDKFPKATIYDNVTTISTPPKVDVLCGGFPCQDLSVAGKRAGLAGQRSGLFFEFIRIIDAVKPKFVVIENVPGLLSSNRGRDMGTVIGSLAKCGYGVAWRVFDSQYFGLAQRRKRVFIVGSPTAKCSAEILAFADGLQGHPKPSRKEGSVSPTLAASGVGAGRTGNERQDVASKLEATNSCNQAVTACIGGGNYGAGNLAEGIPNVAYCLRSGGSQVDKTDSKTYIPVGVGVRRLTPIECERLQGFSDGWTDGFANSTRYKMLGNAVSVPVAKFIGKRIQECVA